MEHLWIKSSHTKETDSLSKIADTAAKKTESNQAAPTKEVLDSNVQEYIEGRFPKTDDDTLQEDIAKKFVLNGEFLNDLHEKYNKGENMQKETISKLWDMYGKQIELGSYLDIHKEMNKRVGKLIDAMRILELETEIKETFPMAKSGISNKEAFMLAKTEALNIKKELNDTKDEGITKESVGELLDRYKVLSEHYHALRSSMDPKHPEWN